jgi:hypothetical protein
MDEVLYERKGAGAWRCLNRPEEASPRGRGPTPPCGAGRVVCLIDPVGRRVCVPIRDPRPLSRRKRLIRSRFRQRVEERTAFPRAARAAVGGRMRQLRALRQLPRRLHGGEVLHWALSRCRARVNWENP